MAEVLRNQPEILRKKNELSAAQMRTINSYGSSSRSSKIIDFNPNYEPRIFDAGFTFPQEKLPEHGQQRVTAAELEAIKSGESISPRFQGQPDLTVAELSEAAVELMNSAAWKKLYEDSIPSTEGTNQVTNELEHSYQTYEKLTKRHNIHIPLFDEKVREVVTTIFTRLPKYDAQSVYSILSAGRAYGLFHRFCTQSFPTNIEPILSPPSQRKSLADSLMATFLPQRVKKLKAQFIKLKPKELGPEIKWRAIDKETRIILANEMFGHVFNYLAEHPNEKVVIIEPGGGNAELSTILAKQIASSRVTAGKATILIREYSMEMAEEGMDKIDQLKQQNPNLDLDIEFLIGSAEIPLKAQLAEIKQALADSDEQSLSKFGLDFKMAQRLLDNLKNKKVIGGISTYTAGAMSTEDGLNTTATRIFDNLAREVDARDGHIIINDFAATPPPELTNSPIFNQLDKQMIKFLREASVSFEEAGLSHGLATVYGLWGEGVGHDTRQIWQTYLRLLKDHSPNLTLEANLRPFSLFPLPFNNRYLNIPGFIETTVRCRGRASDSQIRV